MDESLIPLVKTERVPGIFPPDSRMDWELNTGMWQALMDANAHTVPSSISVKITHDGHTYKGIAYLVEE